MLNRSNEFVYIKRNYFSPFKPLMDYEYKKFGYKKCEIKKGKFFNTVYYVRHKERPKGLCDALYMINLPFSYFRTLVFPILLIVFLICLLIESFTELELALEEQLIVIIMIVPVILISVFLSNMGYRAYEKDETDEKLDRIMKSRNWTLWTSYKDNDSRFTPPEEQEPKTSESTSEKESGETTDMTTDDAKINKDNF